MTVAVNQLAYIGFGVSDAEAWTRFLTATVGMQDSGTTAAGTRHFRLDAHRSRIQLQTSGEDDVIYLGWLVDNRAALVEMEQQLLAAGFDSQRGDKALADDRGVAELIVVTDPCGLRTEIGYGAERDSHPFNPGRPMAAGFVAGDQGVGHVVLKSSDPEGYVTFYEQTLGLDLTDHVINPATGPMPSFAIAFYHANSRHHSLAFPLIPIPAAMGKRIQHFMLQLDDLDDLGRGMKVAQEQEELLNYLGRHSNDFMLSCYLTTPGGIGMEYGWGARSLSPDEPTTVYTDGDLWGHQVAGARSVFDLAKPPPGAPGAGPADAPAPVHAGAHA